MTSPIPGGYGKPIKPLPVKPGKPKKPVLDMRPNPIRGRASDDDLLRNMPITEKQLGQIKKHYGIK